MELRQYGVATTLYFPLVDKGATDFESTPVTIASGDCKISKDGGAFSNTTTASFSHVAGGIYSIPLTATEMQAKVIVVKIVDQTATKEWEDQAIVITTCNNASAEVPTMWASVQDIVAGAITATSIASNAITSAKIATDAIGAAQIATDAITEILNGIWDASTTGHTTAGTFGAQVKTLLDTIAGYIDTEVAAIKEKTDNLPSDPSSASTISSSFSSISSTLSTIAGYIDTEVAAIKAKTDNLPATPASSSDCLTASGIRSAVGLASANLDTQLSDLPTATENADALLTRNMSAVEASAPVHSLTSAVLKLVSRFKGSTGQTYRTNGSTVHMTQTPTADSGADPITELGVAA